MTHALIDIEIVKAIGLSITFMGVLLSIITVGLGFLMYKLSEKKGKEYLKMAGLICAWAIYMTLNSQSSASLDYNLFLGIYSITHLFSIFIGTITIIIFLFMLPTFWKKNVFHKKLLIIAGIFAVLSILMELIFPFFANYYLSLLQRIVIIIPPLLGFFMIIQSYIRNGGRKRND